MPPTFSAFGYIKKPNHLCAKDGWDDSRNFYAFFRHADYRKFPEKTNVPNLPLASIVAVTVPFEGFAVLVPTN
jgi:hypothetical protein